MLFMRPPSLDRSRSRGLRRGAAPEGGDAALVLLFFAALLTQVCEVLCAGAHVVIRSRELVGRGGIGTGLVQAAASTATEGAGRGAAA